MTVTTTTIQLPLGLAAPRTERCRPPAALLGGEGLAPSEMARVRALCRAGADELRGRQGPVALDELARRLAVHDNSRVAAALREALEAGGGAGARIPAPLAEARLLAAAGA